MSRHHRTDLRRGFTLVELMIVIVIITIIATAAIPNLLSSRLTANESSAIATLRTIVSAQAQALTRNAVDFDSDGRGEYLYLAELSGSVNLRGTAIPLDPAAVSVSLGQVANSAVNKSGYMFRMFLPDALGAGVSEDPAGGLAAPAALDADLAETFWTCYAWPASFGSSGTRAFVTNQSGDLLQSSNATTNYDGIAVSPAADSAYSAGNDITAPLSISGAPAAAQDGAVWLPVN